jgi:DNA-binding transcriptional LysR family regulator
VISAGLILEKIYHPDRIGVTQHSVGIYFLDFGQPFISQGLHIFQFSKIHGAGGTTQDAGRKSAVDHPVKTHVAFGQDIGLFIDPWYIVGAGISYLLSKQVVVGGSTIPANYLLPMVISDFCRRYPQVCVDLRIGDSIQICQDVLAGNLDFGIVGGFVDHFDLEHELLLEDKLHLVASPELKPDLPATVFPEHLKGLPWVHREKGSGTRKAFENAMMRCGVSLHELRVSALVQSTEALVRCLLAGAGVGVTSFLAVQEYIDADELKIIDVSGLDIGRSFYIIQHKGRSHFSCSRMLMDSVKKYIQTVSAVKIRTVPELSQARESQSSRPAAGRGPDQTRE